jgi:quercetin dioxygenase-like cupin family protein
MIIQLKDAPEVPFNLDGRILFSTPRAELVHLSLEPEESIGMHANPFEVVFHILSGEGEIATDQTVYKVKGSDTLSIEAEVQRGLKNCGSGPLRLLVFKIF